MNSTTLITGYQKARRWLTSFKTWYINTPMPTTAMPEHIIIKTPSVGGDVLELPSTNAWISEVPTMAVSICTKNRRPTTTAIILLDTINPISRALR